MTVKFSRWTVFVIVFFAAVGSLRLGAYSRNLFRCREQAENAFAGESNKRERIREHVPVLKSNTTLSGGVKRTNKNKHGGREKTSSARFGIRRCDRVSKDTIPVHSKPQNVFTYSWPVLGRWWTRARIRPGLLNQTKVPTQGTRCGLPLHKNSRRWNYWAKMARNKIRNKTNRQKRSLKRTKADEGEDILWSYHDQNFCHTYDVIWIDALSSKQRVERMLIWSLNKININFYFTLTTLDRIESK
jgi:hypothetical protein